VVEVNQPHAHTRRRVGKSDPIDAEMAARLFQAGKAKAVPKQTDGIVESIRLLRVARHSDVKSRTAALVHVRDLIITAPQELRDQISHPKTLRGKAAVCARFRPSGRQLRSPSQAAKIALRSLAQRIECLDRETTALDRKLEQLVQTAAPRTTQLLGISTRHAGQLLVTAGQNIDRLHGENSFAMLCGARPDPCLLRQDHPPACLTAPSSCQRARRPGRLLGGVWRGQCLARLPLPGSGEVGDR
jgi:transposase